MERERRTVGENAKRVRRESRTNANGTIGKRRYSEVARRVEGVEITRVAGNLSRTSRTYAKENLTSIAAAGSTRSRPRVRAPDKLLFSGQDAGIADGVHRACEHATALRAGYLFSAATLNA